jgi:hypothetical protein
MTEEESVTQTTEQAVASQGHYAIRHSVTGSPQAAIGTFRPGRLSARWQTPNLTRIWILEIGLLSFLFSHTG